MTDCIEYWENTLTEGAGCQSGTAWTTGCYRLADGTTEGFSAFYQRDGRTRYTRHSDGAVFWSREAMTGDAEMRRHCLEAYQKRSAETAKAISEREAYIRDHADEIRARWKEWTTANRH